MIKKIALAIVTLSLMTSCVSKKIYNDLENKYTDLKKENRFLQSRIVFDAAQTRSGYYFF